MKSQKRWMVCLLGASLTLWGCGGDDDASVSEADASADTGTGDDTGTGTSDTGTQDTGTQDTGTQDTGTQDTGTQDTGPVATEFELLVEYLEGEGGDYINTAAPKVIAAADVLAEGLDAWTIVDLRSGDKYGPDAGGVWKMEANGTIDYEDGHIEGAQMVTYAELVTWAEAHLEPGDKVLVTCWTGHLAGHAVLVLNLMGYDAYSLKFGMSSWGANFDLWSGKIGSDYAGQFVTDADVGKAAPGGAPMLDTGKTTGVEILDARLQKLLAVPPRFVDAADAAAALDDYYVVNYWSEADYLGMGHFASAHQYTPKASLRSTADLLTLPTDQPILVYCYSGQTGSQVAAWLWILGYDAWDLSYGANALIHDDMTSHQWSAPGDYPVVTD